MPLRDVNSFLPYTITSIKTQTFKNFELIVICPSHAYDEISIFFKSLNIDFEYSIIHTNLNGICFAINLGISLAKYDYIARWDSDDVSDPKRFERQIEEMLSDPSLAIVGTRVIIVDENGVPDRFHKFKFFQNSFQIRSALKYRQPLLHSSLMFRRDILMLNKGYLYGNTSEDHELFIRIARNPSLNFKNIDDVVTYYRRHSSQLSDISSINNQFYEVSGFLFSEFLRTFHPLYVFGILANVPFIRKSRYFYRKLMKYFCLILSKVI